MLHLAWPLLLASLSFVVCWGLLLQTSQESTSPSLFDL